MPADQLDEAKQPATPAEASQAILFADMGGSTKLYDTLGDAEAHRIAGECLGRISRIVTQYEGRVIKTIGDEVMATFETADAASAAACEIQLATTGDEDPGRTPMPVHVGFHYGSVIEDSADVFGDSVNLAARLVGLARAGEILTSAETVACLSEAERARIRQIDHRNVKGKQEAIDVYEVVWQTLELTALNPLPPRDDETAHLCLIFEVAGQRHELSPDRPELQIGRSADNEIVVSDMRASRHHATAALSQGKFILRDASTNGTVVHPRDKKPVVLRREEMILPTAGTISIGVEESEYRRAPIRFHSEPWWPGASDT
jgi:class 3 adenylate cyclase